jgi:hypothetical protein
MKHLAHLVGQPWIDTVVADTSRRAHPLHFHVTQQGAEWSQWREVFDNAMGVVMKLLENHPAARARLVAKIKDRRQFGSTVPEIVWAARLARLGMQVEVEPIIGRAGPDMRFTCDGFTAHAEVYSPVFEADEFSWADDLQEDLERLNVGYHVSCQLLPDRRSENRSLISKALRREISSLQARNDPTPCYRLYLRRDRTTRIEKLSGYLTIGCDPVMEEEPGFLFVADLQRTPELGVITIAAHVSNSRRDARELLRDLGQLQPGANLLIVDASRDFVHLDSIERASDGPFTRRPELSAIAVSTWGVYPAPTTNPLVDHVFVEEYNFIVNPRAETPLPAPMLTAMARKGLLHNAF